MKPDFFIARVVNVKDDKEMIGRALIRVEGDQDDKGRIPDEELRWARPIMNPHDAPQYSGVGRGGTGLLPGTRIFGYYADADRQHPFILGVIPTAGKTQPDGTIVQTGSMEDGTLISAGNPFGNEGDLSFQDNRDMLQGSADMRTEREGPVEQLLKNVSIEAFFAGVSGNGPPRFAREGHILASVFNRGYIADMASFVQRINPENIGGLSSSLQSIISTADMLIGIPSQIIGSLTSSLMGTVSSIINITTSNILDSFSNIASNVSDAIGLSSIDTSFLAPVAAMPLNPVQRLAYNVAVGGIRTGDVGSLSNIVSGVNAIQTLQNINTSQYLSVTNSLSSIAGAGQNTSLALATAAAVSEINGQITATAFAANMMDGVETNYATLAQLQAIDQIQGLARQAGELLGVGDRFVYLANYPTDLIAAINIALNQVQY